MRVGFHTFGCKLNQYETEALADSFRRAGHEVGGDGPGAGLYIVNTCTVTSRGEQKARRLIRSIARREPRAVVVATGCYAQTEAATVAGLGSNVVCLPQEAKHRLIGLASRLGGAPPSDGPLLLETVRDSLAAGSPSGGVFSYSLGAGTFHARAYLKIQDGCDYRCSYCRVPLARGASVSRPVAEVVAEAAGLARAGYRELVLTGVNIASYADGGTGLAELIGLLLASTGEARLRLSSLEPERIQGALLDAVALPRICSHFHLPVQSGSRSILAAMRRRYTPERVLEAAGDLRRVKGDAFIAADLIAGFPGETAAEHAETVWLVEAARFAQLHVFPFSPRPGTEAEHMLGRVPERVRDLRTKELRLLSERLHAEYVARWVGRSVDVLVEEHAAGTSENYLKVRLECARPRGEIARVRLRGDGQGLVGCFVP